MDKLAENLAANGCKVGRLIYAELDFELPEESRYRFEVDSYDLTGGIVVNVEQAGPCGELHVEDSDDARQWIDAAREWICKYGE